MHPVSPFSVLCPQILLFVCSFLLHRFEGAEAAHTIISAGPEPLKSQFNTSYSLVLNLLSVYSLDEAREFLRWVAVAMRVPCALPWPSASKNGQLATPTKPYEAAVVYLLRRTVSVCVRVRMGVFGHMPGKCNFTGVPNTANHHLTRYVCMCCRLLLRAAARRLAPT